MELLAELNYIATIESLEDRVLELEALVKLLLDGEVQKSLSTVNLAGLHAYSVDLDWSLGNVDVRIVK